MRVNKYERSEGVACAMPKRYLWNHGDSINTVLQEICEESYKARVQDQSI